MQMSVRTHANVVALQAIPNVFTMYVTRKFQNGLFVDYLLHVSYYVYVFSNMNCHYMVIFNI